MIETFLAFAIWATTGALFSMVGADPIQTALFRYFFAGLFLQIASIGFKSTGVQNALTKSVPWKDPLVWVGGALLVIGNIFFNVSVSRGPVAISGLTYGYIPIVIPLISLFLGLDQAKPMTRSNWFGLVLAFAGNYFLFQGLNQTRMPIGDCVLAALLAATCFGLGPLLTATLQKRGLNDWALLKGQNTAAMIIAIPVALILFKMNLVSAKDSFILQKSLGLGIFASVGFTIFPFFLWFRGIRKVGPGRTTIFVFLNPLLGCLLSMFGLKDMPMNLLTGGGVALILGGVLLNLRLGPALTFKLPRPMIRGLSMLIVAHPLLFPILCSLALGWDGDQLLQLMVHPFHLLVICLSLVCGFMVFSLNRYALPVFGLFLAGLVGECLAFLEQVPDPTRLIFMPISLIVFMALTAIGFRHTRRFPRVDLEFPGELKLESGSSVAITVTNLSSSGCRFRIHAESPDLRLSKRQIVRLALLSREASESQVHDMRVEILETSGNHIRGRFLKLTSGQVASLQTLMETQANSSNQK